VAELLRRGVPAPVLPSANVEGVAEGTIEEILGRYRGRIKYVDVGEPGDGRSGPGRGDAHEAARAGTAEE
jgi:hypothetical protein